MAWSWSHTAEAYDNARLNIQDLPHEDLVTILAEIRAKKWDDDNPDEPLSFNNGKYNEFYEESDKLSNDILADAIWEFASEYRTCDNGGFNAHVCPYGCHTVSFDRNEEEDV